MSSPFDAAWGPETAFLAGVMGEDLLFSGQAVRAVVIDAESGAVMGQRVRSNGAQFSVLLTVAQAAELAPQGEAQLKGARVVRWPNTAGAVMAQVVSVRNLGGAGVELECGPMGGGR